MNKLKQIVIITAAILLASPAGALPTAETDTLLRVLREELTADFAELQQQQVKPYFMSFRVQEKWEARVIATFGYLGNSLQKHTRTFTPQIRVGTAELDNFKYNSQSGEGASPLPLADTSPRALRAALWLPMITAYDRVSNAYRNAQNRLRSQADNEDKAPCFSALGGSPAETYYEAPPLHPALTPQEQQAWEQRLCRISAAFRNHQQFNRAEAMLHMENQRTHLVNTEGAAIVQNRLSYRVFVEASIQTDDGMELPLMQTYYATSPDSLPSEAEMIRDANDIARRLTALAQAPVADPYTGQ